MKLHHRYFTLAYSLKNNYVALVVLSNKVFGTAFKPIQEKEDYSHNGVGEIIESCVSVSSVPSFSFFLSFASLIVQLLTQAVSAIADISPMKLAM